MSWIVTNIVWRVAIYEAGSLRVNLDNYQVTLLNIKISALRRSGKEVHISEEYGAKLVSLNQIHVRITTRSSVPEVVANRNKVLLFSASTVSFTWVAPLPQDWRTSLPEILKNCCIYEMKQFTQKTITLQTFCCINIWHYQSLC